MPRVAKLRPAGCGRQIALRAAGCGPQIAGMRVVGHTQIAGCGPQIALLTAVLRAAGHMLRIAKIAGC